MHTMQGAHARTPNQTERTPTPSLAHFYTKRKKTVRAGDVVREASPVALL